MTKSVGLAVGVVLGALATIGAASLLPHKAPVVVHAQSATTCDATSLRGSYGYRFNGTAYDSQYNTYLFGAAGRLVFDGAGNVTGSDTLAADGQIIRGRSLTGSYTINPDCTGSLSLSNSSLNTKFDIISVNNGAEWQIVQSDTGFIMTGEMKQQNPAAVASTPTTPVQ